MSPAASSKFPAPSRDELWPELPLASWKDTCTTLHLWTQIVGKIRLSLAPRVNHWWHASLHVTPRGLATGGIPYRGRSFEMTFDFQDHVLRVDTSWGPRRYVALAPKSVAQFYEELFSELRALGIEAGINPMPQEIRNPISSDLDDVHASYDPEYANRHWRVLLQADRLLHEFRSDFVGKCSPVHFFWGSFDLAVTRFSGRLAPPREGADLVTREAYSHEVFSCGFWPGSGNIEDAAFYAYAAPEPKGFAEPGLVKPAEAFYNMPTRGYVLMYDQVRRALDSDRMVLEFLQSAYERAADLGGWDRAALERRSPPRRDARAA